MDCLHVVVDVSLSDEGRLCFDQARQSNPRAGVSLDSTDLDGQAVCRLDEGEEIPRSMTKLG